MAAVPPFVKTLGNIDNEVTRQQMLNTSLPPSQGLYQAAEPANLSFIERLAGGARNIAERAGAPNPDQFYDLTRLGGDISPAAMQEDTGNMVSAAQRGEILPTIGHGLLATMGMAPGGRLVGKAIGGGLEKVGKVFGDGIGENPLIGNNLSPRMVLEDAYHAKAQQMALKPKDRIKPDSIQYLDENFRERAPDVGFEDLSKLYPRHVDPTTKLPKGDRARILVDRKEEIAEILANKIRASGHLGADTQFFYNSDGPIYRGAIKAGLSPEEASSYLKEFAETFAATSPRTKVADNLLNTTSVMAKRNQAIPHREVIGPGTINAKGEKGISERGFAMMTGQGDGNTGIHGKLIDEVESGRGIDPNTNTKPNIFGQNMVGNLSGTTVDTHAIRGALQALNDIEPGLVPDAFIIPKHLDAYKADPSNLTPNMIQDTVGTQMIGPKGARVKAQTEYAPFADIYHRVAEKLGVEPAEAQSLGWFGLGADTGLKSTPQTVSQVMSDRLSITAQLLNISPQEAMRKVFRKEIPLMALPAAAGAMALQGEEVPDGA